VLSSIGEIGTERGPSTEYEAVDFEFDNSSSEDLLRYVDNDNDLEFTSDKGNLSVEIVDDGGNSVKNVSITNSTDFGPGETYDLDPGVGDTNTSAVVVTWKPTGATNTQWNIDLTTSGSNVYSTTEGPQDAYYQVRVDTYVTDLSMTVMQSPGANEIDLQGASVEYVGPDGEQTLGYAEKTNAQIGDFWVEGTTDPDGTVPVLTSRQDRFTVHVELSSDDTHDLRYLQEGEEATVRIVTQSGSQAVAVINVPQSLSSYDSGDAVEV